MKKQKRLFGLALGIFVFTASSCSENDFDQKTVTKALITAGGALGGAFIGSKVSGDSPMLGTVVGGLAGGALGYMAGGAIVK